MFLFGKCKAPAPIHIWSGVRQDGGSRSLWSVSAEGRVTLYLSVTKPGRLLGGQEPVSHLPWRLQYTKKALGSIGAQNLNLGG
jgi:hypothetical protein